MEKKNIYKPIFRGDAWNATFMQIIFLNPANPENRQETLLGYSKELRNPESPDKDFALIQMLRRAAFKYLMHGKALEVKIYRREDRRFTWDQATHILTLRPDKQVIESHVDVTNRVMNFLDKAYEHLAKGELFDEKPKSYLAGKKKHEVLDVYLTHQTAFPTLEALQKFCRSWTNDGMPVGVMTAFFHQYKNRWLNQQSESTK